MNFAKKFPVIATFTLIIFTAGGAPAQTVNGTLRDVDKLMIAIEPMDDDARACGISESRLTKTVTEVAEDAGFTLNGFDYTLYLRISSLPTATDCFSSIDIDVRYVGNLPLPAYPQGNVVRAVLWSNGSVIFSPRNAHGQEVGAVVKSLVEALVVDWARDNSRHGAG